MVNHCPKGTKKQITKKSAYNLYQTGPRESGQFNAS